MLDTKSKYITGNSHLLDNIFYGTLIELYVHTKWCGQSCLCIQSLCIYKLYDYSEAAGAEGLGREISLGLGELSLGWEGLGEDSLGGLGVDSWGLDVDS